MTYLNPMKCGLTLGVLIGIAHVAWSVLVVLGLGQGLMDFIFHIHFLAVGFRVLPFDLVTAATLVAVTSAIAFVLGYGVAVAINSSIEREA